ncbi:hypothetical protein BR63_05530 [Thermanaerosceptrum fracticalcis]|uniref:SLH domain-containing protein n=1 Tax=Thermanaerosceptrum fracticalcis TaxID=1712410 RepID=A0A7G6E165_THEFR|nr:S-layer homology domain-containing protein [Thermanaerosceptrum fracticalcis]QNB45819.1 hypothetical protein BR63_05530 [Thermanaerosceptrum fracticalcis]
MVKSKIKYIVSLLLVFLLLMTNPVIAASGSADKQVAENIKKAVAYLAAVQNSDGGFPSEKGRKSSMGITAWVIMALRAAGEDVKSNKWMKGGRNPLDYLNTGSNLLEATNDYARTLLALTASKCGAEFNGIDLAEKIISFQRDNGQFAQPDLGELELVNSHMWAIIALASAGREIPNKDKAREWLLSQQNEDGGFGWALGGESDPDDTGVAITTLVLLGENPQDSTAIQKALKYLKKCQEADGGFVWTGQRSNAATDAWVIQGLVAVGEDPFSVGWQANGKNPVAHLLSLQNSDGSFSWMKDVVSSPVLMTAYAIMALAQRPFPVNIDFLQNSEGAQKYPFTDLDKHYWAYNPIMELIQAKVLGGYPDGTFRPENPVTRAEFTKFMVYGLGLAALESNSARHFKDVPMEHWAHTVISIAYDQGFVKGKTPETFDPEGKITGAELAAMLVRALPLDEQILIKAGPYWYSGSVDMALEKGLLYPSFDHKNYVTRAQCAYSIAKLRSLTKNQ